MVRNTLWHVHIAMNFRKKPDPHGNCEFDEETGTVKNCLVGLESANKFACDPRVPNYATLKGITIDRVVELLRKIFQHPRISRFRFRLDAYKTVGVHLSDGLSVLIPHKAV